MFNIFIIEKILNDSGFTFILQAVRNVIAFICLFIFSLQMLPLKEIGAILFKGQITEEEVHGWDKADGDGSLLKLKKEGDPFDHNITGIIQNDFRTSHLSHQLHTAILTAENIPPHFVPDILTPPPNTAC